MVLQESPGEQSTDGQPRCEFGTALLGEECQHPGEIRYAGLLLCEPHAELLRLEHRAEAVLGSVFRMDEWLEENRGSSSDEEFMGRIRREREEAVEALRLIRAQIRDARKALSQ
jgi:hypothetical protein